MRITQDMKVTILFGPRFRHEYDGKEGKTLQKSGEDWLVDVPGIGTVWVPEDALIAHKQETKANGCTCGANFTDNPKFHHKWCDL